MPGHSVQSRVLTTPIVLRANDAPTATVTVGEPHPVTGAIFGSVTAVNQGNGAPRYGPTLFTTAKGGLVSVGASTGHFTYTPSVQARQVARASAEHDGKVDSFAITVSDPYGRSVEVDVTVGLLTAHVPPAGAANIQMPDSNGVVVGHIEGAAWDGAQLSFSLRNPSNPADSTAESAYSQKGGLVQLEPDTGRFVFVPTVSTATIPGLDTDRFVVTAMDARGGSVDITVRPLAHLRVDTETTGIAPDVQYGRLSIANDGSGPLRFGVGRPPTKGTARVDPNGRYLYTRTPGLGHGITAEDSFTIIGTDDYGRSITVATVSVRPPLADTRPITGAAHITESAVNASGVQTTRGHISATGPDGHPLSFRGGGLPGNTVLSAKGCTVTVNDDGTFTYSSALNSAPGHAAAAVTALAADKTDHFTVTAEDGTRVVVPVGLLPYNNTPTQVTSGGSGRLSLRKTGSWTTTVVDVDGDDFTYAVIQDKPRGTVTVHRNRQGDFVVNYTSTSMKVGRYYPNETFSIRFYDGHLKGDGSPAHVSATYTF